MPRTAATPANRSANLGYIAYAGFDAFYVDSQVDAYSIVRAFGDRLSLVRNVNNPEVPYAGTPEQAEARARCAIAAGVRIIGPECGVPMGTPLR